MSDRRIDFVARDLARLGQSARGLRAPILLVISSVECPYCQRLKDQVLEPMLQDPDYDGRVVVAELLVDEGETVLDFDGRRVWASDVAARYEAYVTPTLLFLDGQGRSVAERIVGFNTVELYGWYVDAAIDAARRRLSRVE